MCYQRVCICSWWTWWWINYCSGTDGQLVQGRILVVSHNPMFCKHPLTGPSCWKLIMIGSMQNEALKMPKSWCMLGHAVLVFFSVPVGDSVLGISPQLWHRCLSLRAKEAARERWGRWERERCGRGRRLTSIISFTSLSYCRFSGSPVCSAGRASARANAHTAAYCMCVCETQRDGGLLTARWWFIPTATSPFLKRAHRFNVNAWRLNTCAEFDFRGDEWERVAFSGASAFWFVWVCECVCCSALCVWGWWCTELKWHSILKWKARGSVVCCLLAFLSFLSKGLGPSATLKAPVLPWERESERARDQVENHSA